MLIWIPLGWFFRTLDELVFAMTGNLRRNSPSVNSTKLGLTGSATLLYSWHPGIEMDVTNITFDRFATIRARWARLPPHWRWDVVEMIEKRRPITVTKIITMDGNHLATISKTNAATLEAIVMAPEDVRTLFGRIEDLENTLRSILDLSFLASGNELRLIQESARLVLEKKAPQ